MDFLIKGGLGFNPVESQVMHVDINSCFATIEQQANPFLRGKPVVVAAYDSPRGVVLAASYEAKKFGVRTGSLVQEAKRVISNLNVLTGDPDKYRYVHLELRKILEDYADRLFPKSIDEFVLHFDGSSVLRGRDMWDVGREIKRRIKSEIGEVITVSVGISTNRFLAKLASNLQKPDGLCEINRSNFLKVYSKLKLVDLSGINRRNEARLNVNGIVNVLDFYNAPLWKLRSAFRSVEARYWHARLRGWEVDGVGSRRKTFGNSYSLPEHDGFLESLRPILMKLCEKTGLRMRRAGFGAYGVRVGVRFKNRESWHKGRKVKGMIFDSRDIYFEAVRILAMCPKRGVVHTLFVTCFALVNLEALQLSFLDDFERRKKLVAAVDEINGRWGEFSVISARAVRTKMTDRIGFGNIRELV